MKRVTLDGDENGTTGERDGWGDGETGLIYGDGHGQGS